jgi:topoisomerase-4 subunit A
LGDRRTTVAEAAPVSAEIIELPVERWPATVILSERGWIRAARGHLEEGADVKYKEGDRGRFLLKAQSTDKLLLFAADGRAFTLAIDRLPSGRGQGEPLSLLIDLAKGVEIIQALVHRPGGQLVLATRDARGFVAPEAELLAQTKAGRQVVNLAEGEKLSLVRQVEGELVALSASNRKVLVFPLTELPVMSRGRGLMLMRIKDGELADLVTFDAENGLTWRSNGTEKRFTELASFQGKRAGSGRAAPRGFPKNHRFG